MYGCCLSDVHLNDFSANSWRVNMNQDNKGQPQQGGGQSDKPGQQGQQQPGQNPGQQQQTQQPSQKPGQDASKT